MARWFRWTDIFAMVGVALLIATTPAYVAQSESEEDLSGGRDFVVPKPRIGMTLEQEVVFRWAGEDPVVVGPIAVQTVRAPSPGEGPQGALYVVDEQYLAGEYGLGWGTFRVEESLTRTYYSAEGLPIFQSERFPFDHDDVPGGDTDQWVERRMYASDPGTWNNWADARLHYHPSGIALGIKATQRSFQYELAGRDGPEDRYTDPQAFYEDQIVSHRGILLLRDNHSPDDPFGSTEEAACAECFTDLPGSTYLTLHGEEARVDYSLDHRHDWLSPSWPAPVGSQIHAWVKETSRKLEIVYVPASIHPGEGDPLPLGLRAWQYHQGHNLPTPGHDLPTVPLRSLQDDTAALYGSISMVQLRGAVRSDLAPATVREFAAKAWVTDFVWVSDALRTEILPSTPSPLSLLGQKAPGETVVRGSSWAVVLTDERLERLVVHLTFEERDGSVQVKSVADACTEGLGSMSWAVHKVRCGPSQLPLDMDAPVGRPAAVVQRADALAHRHVPPADPDRAPFTSFAYLPTARHTLHPLWGQKGVSDYALDLRGMHRPGGHHGPADQLASEGIAHWWDNTTQDAQLYGDMDLRDMGFIANVRVEDAPPSPPPQGLRANSADADVLRPMDVVPQAVVTSGILLVVLSIATRTIITLKTIGLPAPLVGLYAKISQAQVLLHGRRQEIVAYLTAEPGATRQEVGIALGYGWGATVHHLETLRKNGVLVAVHVHGHRHYFPADLKMGAEERRVLAARRSGPAAAFLDAVVAKPGANLKEIAEAVGTKSSAASRIAARLAKEGLVAKKRDGMSVRFYPAASAA